MTIPHPARMLLSARAVRERAGAMLRLCEDDRLAHWRLERSRLPAAADFTLDVMRDAYPSLDIPFHARWRHFVTEGRDLWAEIAESVAWRDSGERARAECDLAIVSVLLDAGAGPDWRYRTRSGQSYARSEGLALASLELFAAGFFSARADAPLRVDSARLATLNASELGAALQHRVDNRLVGLEGRVALLNALGRVVADAPHVFAQHDSARPGGLADALAAPRLAAEDILGALLVHLGPIWPARLTLEGVALGDTWRHPLIRAPDRTDGFVPIHKLSQWLSYSLIEPLARAGVEIVDIDGLTGLAEYRNGGLFVDMGVLQPKDRSALARAHEVGSAFVVEWRALTVALLDELATALRARLGRDARTLPLACVLEGGAWAAGRKIARQTRADGGPPFAIVSDGATF